MLPDPAPTLRPEAIVPWRLPKPEPVPGARGFRAAGASVGLVVAVITIVIAIEGPFPTGFGWVGTGVSGVGTILGGAGGGWLLGPETWRARTLLGWARLVTMLGLVAVAIGGLTVGLAMGLELAATPEVPALLSIVAGLAYGLLFAVIGIPTFGMFVLPITLAAGSVWAIVMRLLRPKLEAVVRPTGGAA
jgi:MFS family permease